MTNQEIMITIKQVATALELNPLDPEVIDSCVNELVSLYNALEQTK